MYILHSHQIFSLHGCPIMAQIHDLFCRGQIWGHPHSSIEGVFYKQLLYGPINTRCPFYITENSVFTGYFFLYIHFRHMMSHVFPYVLKSKLPRFAGWSLHLEPNIEAPTICRMKSSCGTKQSYYRIWVKSILQSPFQASITLNLKPCCFWLPMSSCTWGVKGINSLEFLRR